MRLRLLLTPLVLVGAMLALTLFRADAQAGSAGLPATRGFFTPSGNILCAAFVARDTATMRCNIRRTAGRDLPEPKGCQEQGDWFGGRIFSLGRRGPAARICPTDALLPDRRPPRLAYGTSWRHGPFRCLSSRLALLCTNATGNGVLLSYERQQVF